MHEAVPGTNSAIQKTKEGIVGHNGRAAMAGNWCDLKLSLLGNCGLLLFVCLLHLDGIWHLGWWLISIVSLPGFGITWETYSWGCLGGFPREASLRKGDPPWLWLAPPHGLVFWTKWKEWKECQNSLIPVPWSYQMWGAPDACSSHHKPYCALPVIVDCTLFNHKPKEILFPLTPFCHSHEKYK